MTKPLLEGEKVYLHIIFLCRVSTFYIAPFVYKTDPPTGSDITALDVLAKKFSFTYEIIPEISFDVSKDENGNLYGLVYSVRYRATVECELFLKIIGVLCKEGEVVSHCPKSGTIP